MSNGHRNYSKEFKQEAVRLVQKSGKTAAQVAADLGIAESNLSRWFQQANDHGSAAFPGSGHQRPEEEELRQLKRELEVTRMERDILKKPHRESLLDELMGNQLNLAFWRFSRPHWLIVPLTVFAMQLSVIKLRFRRLGSWC